MVNTVWHKKHILLLHSNMHIHFMTATAERIRQMKYDLILQPHIVEI